MKEIKISTHHQSPKTIRFMKNLAFCLAGIIILNICLKYFLVKLESDTVRLFAFLSFRWLLLSFGTVLLFLIVKSFVDLRFFYFIEHIAHQLQKMVKNDPHEIFISDNRVRKWNIRNLNPAITKIVMPCWKKHLFLKNKKENLKHMLESSASSYDLKKFKESLNDEWKGIQ